jgi:hypothetical protein
MSREQRITSWSIVFLCLLLLFWDIPAKAQQLGDWSEVFQNQSGSNSFDYALVVPQDGTVKLVATIANTLISQYSAISVLDQSGGRIDFTYLMSSPKTLEVPLAAGSYVVRIGRSLNNLYGNYRITADLTPANGEATEVENNDSIAAANTHPNNLFAGAIGHWRDKDTLDNRDYYSFTLAADSSVRFDVTLDQTLVHAQSTVLSLRNVDDVQMAHTYLSQTSKTWDLQLAPGTYYLRVATHLANLHGGYTISTRITPALVQSSEFEINDTIAAANSIRNRSVYGSIGFYRDKDAGGREDWDRVDYFSCQVAQGGSLSVEILPEESLYWRDSTISIRDGNDTRLNAAYISGSPRSVTIENVNPGTYYIRIHAPMHHGAYQLNFTGDLILDDELSELEKADLLFNWLESLAPALLPPGAQTVESGNLIYRYYSTGVFLATFLGDLYFIDQEMNIMPLGTVDSWLPFVQDS